MDSNGHVKADKGIPMPTPSHGNTRYPWKTMEVGESFLFSPAGSGRSSLAQAWTAGKQTGRKFVVRKTDDGFRCWRVA